MRHLPPSRSSPFFPGTPARQLTSFLTSGLSGVTPAAQLRATGRRPASAATHESAHTRRSAGAATDAVRSLACNRMHHAAPLPFTVGAVFPIMEATGQVAQLVEHRTENPGVGGSIPPLSTVKIES